MSRESVLREVTEADGAIILFIDEIHTVVGAGKADGAMDAGNLLKPALARGQLRCIGATARRGGSEGAASPSGPPLCAGATTLDEYRQHIEKDAALERRFQQAAVAGGGGDRAVVHASLLLPSAGLRGPADGGGDHRHSARPQGAVRATTSTCCVAPASPCGRKERMSRS